MFRSTLIMLIVLVSNAYADRYSDLPILERPPTCNAAITISPSGGKGQTNVTHRAVIAKVKNILKSKGYTPHTEVPCESVVRDSDFPDGRIIFRQCVGGPYYLSIRMEYEKKRFLFRGIFPVALKVKVTKYGQREMDGDGSYYRNVGFYYENQLSTSDGSLEEFKLSPYYNSVLVQQAMKVPSCEDIRLQRIIRR